MRLTFSGSSITTLFEMMDGCFWYLDKGDEPKEFFHFRLLREIFFSKFDKAIILVIAMVSSGVYSHERTFPS